LPILKASPLRSRLSEAVASMPISPLKTSFMPPLA